MSESIYVISLACVVYAYIGYWIVLRLFARRRPRIMASISPSVSVVMAVRHEAGQLAAKLENLNTLDYSKEKLQIIVVLDGPAQSTQQVLTSHPKVEVIPLLESAGKAAALNAGVAHATGEMLFFVDVRQRLEPDSLSHLVKAMSDPSVGAVSGELMLESEEGLPTQDALGIYWKIEKSLRRLESNSGSVVGVTGAIYLLRRKLFRPLPPGLILDDLMVPMNAVRQGYRVVFEPAAVAWDRIFQEQGKEFARKVRTLTGNYQLVQMAPWLLTRSNPLLFRFVSHKLMRLVAPVFLLCMLLSAAASSSQILQLPLALQVVFLALSLLGMLFPVTRKFRAVSIPYTFTMLNVAASLALYKFVFRRSVWR